MLLIGTLGTNFGEILSEIQENAFGNVVYEMAAILSRPQCVDVICHDDVIKWKYYRRCWPFVQGIPSHRWILRTKPVPRVFDVFFDLRLNKRLGKQPRRRWFATPSSSLLCHCNSIQHFCSCWVPVSRFGCTARAIKFYAVKDLFWCYRNPFLHFFQSDGNVYQRFRLYIMYFDAPKGLYSYMYIAVLQYVKMQCKLK